MSSSMGAGPFAVEDERAALCARDRARVVCLGELLSPVSFPYHTKSGRQVHTPRGQTHSTFLEDSSFLPVDYQQTYSSLQ